MIICIVSTIYGSIIVYFYYLLFTLAYHPLKSFVQLPKRVMSQFSCIKLSELESRNSQAPHLRRSTELRVFHISYAVPQHLGLVNPSIVIRYNLSYHTTQHGLKSGLQRNNNISTHRMDVIIYFTHRILVRGRLFVH